MNKIDELIETVVLSIVDNPDKVKISKTPSEDGQSVLFEVAASKDDVGKLIGREGRVARSLRTLVKAAGAKAGVRVLLNIMKEPLA